MWAKIFGKTIDVCFLAGLVSVTGAVVAKSIRKIVEEVKCHGRNPQ